MQHTKKNILIQRNCSIIFDTYPKLKDIISLCMQQGGRVLLVGGAVRDILLGTPYHDIDIEVYGLTIDKLEAILSIYGSVLHIGKSFGILRLDTMPIDFSIPRIDSKGRKPEVELNPHFSFEQAFRRRDLTINAMGIDLHTSKLIDPFNGQLDLTKKILKAPDPNLFADDPLRFFRVMHFIGRFSFSPDETLNNICRSMDISQVSRERIEAELRKLLLLSNQPSLGFRWVHSINRLSELFPELYAIVNTPQRPDYHPEGSVFEHSMQTLDAATQWRSSEETMLMVRYAALCHDLGKATTTKSINGVYRALGHAMAGVQPTKNFLSRITQQKDFISGVTKLVRYHMEPLLFIKNNATDHAYKKLAQKLAPQATLELLTVVSCADRQGRNPESHIPFTEIQPSITQFLEKARSLSILHHPEPPVLQGRDLTHLIPAGPRMGELLKKAYEFQIKKGITDKSTLLTIVCKHLNKK